MKDKPVLSASAPTVEGETKSLNSTSADPDPSPVPNLHVNSTGTGAGTLLPPQSPVAPAAASMDSAPVASDKALGSPANPQAAIPISGSTEQQELQSPSVVSATPMDLDHPADRPGEPETS